MTRPPETPEDLGHRLQDLLLNGNRPQDQDEALDLIAAGANVRVKSHLDIALRRAARCGHTAIVLALIKKSAEIESRCGNSNTALHWAARFDHTAIAIILLENGADIDAKDNEGYTALHWAAEKNHTNTALLLIKKGADVNVKNNRAQTAEALACEMRNTTLANRIHAAHLERATRGFREGLEHATPALPCLQVPKRRSLAP